MIFRSAEEKYGAVDLSRDVPDIEFRHGVGHINGIVHAQGPLRVVDAPSHRRIRAHSEPDQRSRDSPKSLVYEDLHEMGYFAPKRFAEVKHDVECDDPIDTAIEGRRPGGKVSSQAGAEHDYLTRSFVELQKRIQNCLGRFFPLVGKREPLFPDDRTLSWTFEGET